MWPYSFMIEIQTFLYPWRVSPFSVSLMCELMWTLEKSKMLLVPCTSERWSSEFNFVSIPILLLLATKICQPAISVWQFNFIQFSLWLGIQCWHKLQAPTPPPPLLAGIHPTKNFSLEFVPRSEVGLQNRGERLCRLLLCNRTVQEGCLRST